MINGYLLKKMRMNRSLTRKELAEGVVSVRTLQRFENSSAKIDVDSFFLLLDRLNVLVDDYFFEVQAIETNKKVHYRQEFKKALSNKDTREDFIQLMEFEYQKSLDIFYLYMTIEAKTVANRMENHLQYQISKNELTRLYEYLSNVEEWGYFELAMYTNCLDLFNSNLLSFNYIDVIAQFKKFDSSLKHKNAFVKFLVNSLIICFERGEYKTIPELLDNLFNLTNNSDLAKGRIYWKYFNSLYQSICVANHSGDTGTIYIEMFKLLGYEQEARNLEEIGVRLNDFPNSLSH
ncbi:helix-turn-helix domain-containing protein [Enterococcus sp.]|uniref:Rgg/GadR/MutR family transcriptional regulator n=1 Tax=Enterococcus sp. TaxID=35783 RepID=UPI003C78C73C